MYLSLRLCAIIYNKGCVVRFKTSKEELLEFPEDVIDEIGYILYRVQTNQTHTKIKPLKGFNGVFEIRSNYQTDTYSTVYAIKIDDAGSPCFQEKITQRYQNTSKNY